MYHTTGFSKDDIIELCALVHAECADAPRNPWPPILGLYKAMVVTLTYLRRNRVQVELGEAFEVSQPTISRAITALTPLLGRVLAGYSRSLRTWTLGPSTSWTARSFPAGHGLRTPSCTPASTRPPG